MFSEKPKTEEKKQAFQEELKNVPIVPIYANTLFYGVEATLQVLKAINLLSILLLVKFHKKFEKSKPNLIDQTNKVQTKINNVDYSIKNLYQKRITFLLLYLRQNRPKQYYQL